MATVRYARFETAGGFSRAVAIKRLHVHLASDPVVASLFLDEARLSARISHANVVATLDVLSDPEQVAVVMEYVHGESLASVLSLAQLSSSQVPTEIAVALLVGVLHGLHAAHETRSEHGEPLGIVHRDVSPENVLIGVDGVPRVLDFGIAKAKGRCRTTPRGELKGKLGYMAPEQFRGEQVDRRVDVYGAAVVLWEVLTGQPLFRAENDAQLVHCVLNAEPRAPSSVREGVPSQLDALVLRGLAPKPDQRFQTAREFALALERELTVAPQSELSDWLHGLAGAQLQRRAAMLGLQRDAAQEEQAAEGSTRRLPVQAAEQVLTRLAPSQEPAVVTNPAHSSRVHHAPRLRRSLLAAALLVLAGAAWVMLAWRVEPPARPAAAKPVVTPARAPASAPESPLAPPVTVERAAAGEPASSPPVDKPRSAKRRERREDDCTPPYDIDKLGIRRWKRQCL